MYFTRTGNDPLLSGSKRETNDGKIFYRNDITKTTNGKYGKCDAITKRWYGLQFG